jgi:3-dehydroquinate synthase
MQEHIIHTPSKSYPVYIGPGSIQQLPIFLQDAFSKVTKIMIISDETVSNLHLPSVKTVLNDFQVVEHIVPKGEAAKTFETYYECLSFALEQKLDRRSLILALGGGAVGDLAGFVASSFMRGIPFIQIPTTILAHDSAVGGKVAINHPLGKNMIGAFYQPEGVVYDISFLQTLPKGELRSGFAEVIKHALIQDENLYDWLRLNVNELDCLPFDDLQYMLLEGIKIKGKIVAEDEKENGIRAYLNFGHTLGHAIEAEVGYGAITHGEAVLIGMLFALQLSEEIAGLQWDKAEFISWVTKLGYSLDIPRGLIIENLIERMKQDKKTIGQNINFVLLKDIGRPALIEIGEESLKNQLMKF